MSLSQRAGTPGRRTQRAPARRANRHAAISFAAQRHFFGAGLTPAKPNRGKALEGPLPTSVPYEYPTPRQHTCSGWIADTASPHATGTPPISRTSPASPISFQGDTALHVKPSPGKSAFQPLLRRSRSRRALAGGRPFHRPLTAAVTPPSAKAARSQRPPPCIFTAKRSTICSGPAPSPAARHPVRGAGRCGSAASLHRVDKGGPPCSLS